MKKILCLFAVISIIAGCGIKKVAVDVKTDCRPVIDAVLPVTGTFINLAYQDVRNLYTNPPQADNTDPDMWKEKIAEMKEMGMEYLIFMAVANEGRSYYPSELMDWQYPKWRESPVDAIMDAAAEHGMKVFMSTGWAKDQDDNLRDPKIKGRQIQMMEELASIYGDHPAMFGWYLPVEDCLGPVLSDYAVEAVNSLTARARELTPGKKILISPYGIFNSDFDDPRYERQLSRLTVDIIAYQDEVGCVREPYPMTRLRSNWKKLREIHDRTGVQMWANCESFAWSGNTNDRTSALIPASFSRFLSQMAAASAAGVDRIISFIMCGIYDKPSSPYQLGQPQWSAKVYEDYMAWKRGDPYWKAAESAMTGRFQGRVPAHENPSDRYWTSYDPGEHDVIIDLGSAGDRGKVLLRMLNSQKDGIVPPETVFLFKSPDGKRWTLDQIRQTPVFPNTRHDTFVDCLLFDSLSPDTRYINLTFRSRYRTMMDEIRFIE